MEAKSSVCQPIGTIGDVVEGVVKLIKLYGAFVDLGGFDGLLFLDQISKRPVKSVESILKKGDKLKVMVLSRDLDRGRIALSTKKLEPSPGDMLRDPRLVFDKAEETAEAFRSRAEAIKSLAATTQASTDSVPGDLAVGDVVEGVVQSVEPHGAVVDLGGITGALHVSQISHTRIESAESILKEGDKLKVMILRYDQDKGRVALSTRELEPTPWDMLRDPQLVFDKAREVAEAFKSRAEALKSQAAVTQASTEDVPRDLAPPGQTKT
ncbi:hypothetical protein V8C86DRAFT_3095298 [Haematococcus lacustris]